MTNEIKLNMENLSETEREQLMKIVEKANKPKDIVWTPENGEEYWYLKPDGEAEVNRNYNMKFVDTMIRQFQQVFPNRAEALEEAKRIKCQLKWKQLSIKSGELENPWKTDYKHWYVYYDCTYKNICISSHYRIKAGEICFASKKALEEAVKTIGEENVKKYILEVND